MLSPQDKFKSPDKAPVVDWIKSGMKYLHQNPEMVKKSFLVCGITNAIDGLENRFIQCARELPDIQLPSCDKDDDPFLEERTEDEECDSEEETTGLADYTED